MKQGSITHATAIIIPHYRIPPYPIQLRHVPGLHATHACIKVSGKKIVAIRVRTFSPFLSRSEKPEREIPVTPKTMFWKISGIPIT
jgi:hypothetical protein